MKKISGMIVAILALLGVAVGGYWLGSQRTADASSPDGTTSHSTRPSKYDSQVAGYDKGRPGVVESPRKVLYYRNPMGLPDTSPGPKKDAMGMDYVPVYEGNEVQGNDNAINISIEKVQKLGVKSEAAALRVLDKTIRAAGRIEIDERRTYTIAPKFEGWVERLYVNTSGQSVSKGQPLFDVYSPELVSAQREYALARQGEAALQGADGDGDSAKAGMRQLAESGRARLKNWDITEAQLRQLASGNAKRSLSFHAPVSGIVLEKKAVQGMRFMPGEVLYQIADLSSVWVLAEVAEQDIGSIGLGSLARVRLDAYPDKPFDGKVAFIYPTLNSATRTVQVRVEVANPHGLLKPAMFAQVELPAGGGKVLTVPTSAVIDSGTRQIVLVQLAQGRFEPREARLGGRSDNYVEILGGLIEGEQVVTSANFLIDAESNLKAALGGLGGHAAHGGNVPAAVPKPAGMASGVGHQGEGKLDAVNSDGSVSITHGPIKSLGWPGMTMDFALANPSLAQGIQPGSTISFELVERAPGEWVVTRLQAVPATRHEGH